MNGAAGPLRILALAAASITLAASSAQASCGASSCEMDSSAAAPRSPREGRLGYEFEFVPQARRWSGRNGASAQARGGHHDESYSVTRIHRLTAAAGLSPRWSASVQIPFIARSHGHVHNHRGGRIDETWSVPGLGDVALEARYAFWRAEAGSTWSLGAGGELPTGRRRAENSSGSDAEAGILPGSGSYDASISLLWQRPIGRGGIFASLARRFNGPGEEGYRLGDTLMAHAGATAPVGRRWTGMLQVNALSRRRDWKGSTREDTANTGGEAVYLTPGLEYSAGGGLGLSASVQLPVYQRVNGLQIVSDYAVRAGVGYRFSF